MGDFSSVPGYTYALAVGEIVSPDNDRTILYHGTSDLTFEAVRQSATLPARGNDIELLRHVEPLNGQAHEDSAFRGCTELLYNPVTDQGALAWAGPGGYAFRIQGWPHYNISTHLDGRISDGMGGYRSPTFIGENELAVPAPVPSDRITAVYVQGTNTRTTKLVPICIWSAATGGQND